MFHECFLDQSSIGRFCMILDRDAEQFVNKLLES